jgi:Zn-dependent protease
MQPVSTVKLAAEAEAIRLRAMARRQGMQAAFATAVLIFALGMLALLNVTAYQLLRLALAPLFASLIVLLIDLAIAAALGALAIRSSPSQTEQDAVEVRQRAIHEFEGSLAMSALLPVVGGLGRSGRKSTPKRRRLLSWGRR